MSIERYEAMAAADTSSLGKLAREFDELVARMQTDEARAGVDALFGMSGEDLADAAVRGAERDDSE